MSININIEKLKKDITSEDILASLFYYAVFGEKISQNDLERFKWHGIYAKDEKQTSFSLKIPDSSNTFSAASSKAAEYFSRSFRSAPRINRFFHSWTSFAKEPWIFLRSAILSKLLPLLLMICRDWLFIQICKPNEEMTVKDRTKIISAVNFFFSDHELILENVLSLLGFALFHKSLRTRFEQS